MLHRAVVREPCRTSRYLHLRVLPLVRQKVKVTVCTSARELEPLRHRWESLVAAGCHTVFQHFDLNLLAARMFAGREGPFVVCAESSQGVAIVPAVVRHSDQTLRLLGEELFDYRSFLHHGDPEVLRAAMSVLAQRELPLEVVAVRADDNWPVLCELTLLPFCSAPAVRCADISVDDFSSAHPHLTRNLRRLVRLGFEVKKQSGGDSALLRSIYERKAAQDSNSLFHDPLRIDFLVRAAKMLPEVFEIFTLQQDSTLAAAVLVLRDRSCRRFYTGWFAPELAKHSPALTLIHETTRQSLAAGFDCDYMTGEQPYKMRLATSAAQLYRMRASAEQLTALSELSSQHSAFSSETASCMK